MKKLLSLLIVSVLVISCFAGCGGGEKPTLKVYNAGEYMDMNLKSKFEKEYNCNIIYETFDSNETMYTKIQSGESYDILIPSDYMVERLIKEDYLQPIDKSLITNMDAVIPEILGKDYDPEGEYTVPYFWGSVGILYDTTVVDEADVKAGWDLLLNEKYSDEIYMYDSERDSFMIALKALGYSMNTDNPDELNDAYEWLINQKEKVNPVYVGDEVIDNMISGNKAIAIVYSGDASYIMTENPNLDYTMPDQGTNIWYDSMVITKNCQNTDLAHKFIDFMLREENALSNTEVVGYSSSVKSVFETMQKDVYAGISAYVPRTDYEKDEVFRYQSPEIKKLCAELWTKVKSK